MAKAKYMIFSDESGQDGNNRFGAIGMISGAFANMKRLNESLSVILAASKKEEIKFKSIKNERSFKLATAFLSLAFLYMAKTQIKADVIIWDKQDSRHKIKGRDDLQNMKIMYYQNLKSVIQHWKVDTEWEFYPDEFTAIEWRRDVVRFLENTKIHKDEQQTLFADCSIPAYPVYKNVKELDSKMYPLLQLADLFTGITRNSRAYGVDFYRWYKAQNNQSQLLLFDFNEPDLRPSNSKRHKYKCIKFFKEQADQYRLGVNLSDSHYLKTFGRQKHISIWHYSPQGNYDKAPIKNTEI